MCTFILAAFSPLPPAYSFPSPTKNITHVCTRIYTRVYYQLSAMRNMLIYLARQGTFGECGLAKITEGKSWGKQAEALCVAKAAGSKTERKRMNPTTQQWNRQLA